MRKYLFLLIFLASCGQDEGEWLVSSPRDHSMVNQQCIFQDEALVLAEISIPIFLKHLKKNNWIEKIPNEISGMSVCVILEPEPCRFAGYYRPPFSESGIPSRKNGCASHVMAWSSATWPPLCRDEWHDEPHCENETRVVDWKMPLLHEIFNMLVLKYVDGYLGLSKDYYDHNVYEIEALAVEEILGVLNE